MNKIYLVSEGEYSDYRICYAFSTADKAQSYIDECGGDLEEYEIDPNWRNDILNYKEGYYPFSVVYNITTREFISTKGTWWTSKNIQNAPPKNYCLPYGNHERNKWLIKCIAKDDQHAIKIASERVAQIIALNQINLSFTEYWDIKFGAGNNYSDL